MTGRQHLTIIDNIDLSRVTIGECIALVRRDIEHQRRELLWAMPTTCRSDDQVAFLLHAFERLASMETMLDEAEAKLLDHINLPAEGSA